MLILVSRVTSSVSISVFDSLVCIPVVITSSAEGIKTYAITAEIKKYKSIIKKKKKKHNKIVLMGKDQLNTIEVLICKIFIHSHISHEEFVSVNNILKEYYKIKKERKNS